MNAGAVAHAIDLVGKPATLRRVAGPGRFVSVTLKAVWRGYRPQELAGGIVQGDREVRIGNAEITACKWPGPPWRGDQMILEGRTFTVMVADTPTWGRESCPHRHRRPGGKAPAASTVIRSLRNAAIGD
jgi:hypothetical protein